MDPTSDERLVRARAASEAGRTTETYRLFLPLAEAGHPEAMAAVGVLLYLGAHRHETYASLEAAPAADPADTAADHTLAARYLQAASDAGFGPASFNLAGLVAWADGFGTWEERKARAAELFALAHAQGFTAFAHLMNRDGGGQPYLDIIEGHARASGSLLPGMSAPPLPPATSANPSETDK